MDRHNEGKIEAMAELIDLAMLINERPPEPAPVPMTGELDPAQMLEDVRRVLRIEHKAWAERSLWPGRVWDGLVEMLWEADSHSRKVNEQVESVRFRLDQIDEDLDVVRTTLEAANRVVDSGIGLERIRDALKWVKAIQDNVLGARKELPDED